MKFGRFWENLGDSKWLKEASGTSDEKARASKYDWTGALDNPECPGNVLTLNPGEATRISSHKSYGEKTYPDNYRVRRKRYFLCHPQVILKSSSSHTQVILKSSSSHPQDILKSSSSHPQVIHTFIW